MTYTRLKRLIQGGTCDKEALLIKLDVFLMASRISNEQYEELVELLNN